jgi:hypothetical protein
MFLPCWNFVVSAPLVTDARVFLGIFERIGRRFSSSRAVGEGAMSLLISILITFLVIVLVLYLVNLLPIDGRAKQIVRVIVIIIGVLSLLRYLGVGF